MAGIWGTFEDVKKIVVIVVILVVVAFSLGYCKGYQSGKGESSVPDWKNPKKPSWKE